MTMPIIIYQPKVVMTILDAAGSPTSDEPIDVSCDLSSLEIGVDQPSNTVSTFCGKFQIPDDIEESVTAEFTINADTDDNWSRLVGTQCQLAVWDRVDATDYRTVNVSVSVNPSLYGTTAPGEARQPSIDFPVLGPVAWANGSYTAPSS